MSTANFVVELLEAWLKEIKEASTLDDLDKLITARRAMLMIENEDIRIVRCVDALKRCKSGDKMYVIKPFPMPKHGKAQTAAEYNKHIHQDARMTCKFYQYQPKAKRLWVQVPWHTTRTHFGKNFIMMEMADIVRMQPSRTELELRRK